MNLSRQLARQSAVLLVIVPAFSLLLTSGCSWLTNSFHRGLTPPQIFNQQVTKEQIITTVNANSQAIRSMQAKVQVRATGTPTLSGDLSVEQPSRLRMQVGLLGMTNSGLDLGSNDNEFWVWIKSALPGGQPPAVLFASHEQYERSAVKQAIPIEPAWVIDSLGLAYFDPRLQHEGPIARPDGSLEIRSRYQSQAGVMLKSTIVDPRTSVVIAQELYRDGRKVAASKASKHQYFPEINASIPRLIEIEAGLNTPQPGKVTIELSGILPNSIDAGYVGLWEMPRPKNIEMINIASQSAGPNNFSNQLPTNPQISNRGMGTSNMTIQSAGNVYATPGNYPPNQYPPNRLDYGQQPPSFGQPSSIPPTAMQRPAAPVNYEQGIINQDYLPRGFGGHQ